MNNPFNDQIMEDIAEHQLDSDVPVLSSTDSLYSTEYEMKIHLTAAAVLGQGASFMDNFNSDACAQYQSVLSLCFS